MLPTLRRPSLEACFRLRDAVARADVTYPHVGATQGDAAPVGYRWTRTRIRIGTGHEDFAAACQAIREWRMLPPEIAEVWPAAPRIAVDEIAIVRLTSFGLRALGPCRIVYCVDELDADVARFGFAYGTLPGHIATGEERFLVGHDAQDDAVWYELTAFSRAATWLTRLTVPILRAAQREFVRRSVAAMSAAIDAQTTAAEEA
ncbi:MAG: DUF1990 domain-containing protein [Pirellulales bacterium]